jgi:uncharacterized membrane protein
MTFEAASRTREESLDSLSSETMEIFHSGPLPHPEILCRYEETLPGSAERVFRQFEIEAEHRRSLEVQVIRADVFSQLWGSIGGSLIGLLGVGGGIWLAHEGKDLAGLATLVATLGGLITVFLYQSNDNPPSDSDGSNESD